MEAAKACALSEHLSWYLCVGSATMPEQYDLSTEEERQFAEGQPRGFPFDPEFRIEDVMLPENDDMGIASEDDEVLEEEIETETGFGSVIGVSE